MAEAFSKRHLMIPTPFGEVAVVYRGTPFLILKVALPSAEPGGRGIPVDAEIGAPGKYEKARLIGHAVHDYFRGKPLCTPWPWLAVGVLTQMQQEVLRAVASIPYGRLSSYKQIAEAIGHPPACRAVGAALARNPFPLLIPCHRVIRNDGSVGLFGGGQEMKRRLIDLEARNSIKEFDAIRLQGARLNPDYRPVPSSGRFPRG